MEAGDNVNLLQAKAIENKDIMSRQAVPVYIYRILACIL